MRIKTGYQFYDVNKNVARKNAAETILKNMLSDFYYQSVETKHFTDGNLTHFACPLSIR